MDALTLRALVWTASLRWISWGAGWARADMLGAELSVVLVVERCGEVVVEC